jgi:hypothetical protein
VKKDEKENKIMKVFEREGGVEGYYIYYDKRKGKELIAKVPWRCPLSR